MKNTKTLLIGKNGQVGSALQRALQGHGEVVSLGRAELDLRNVEQIRSTIRDLDPDVVVNAAAYTAVDKAEEETDLARAVNGVAPGVLAEEAERVGALLVHYSTDYVFDGSSSRPYRETDSPNPINAYGRTKLKGERRIVETEARHLILRTSWVYDMEGRNFVRTMKRLAAERDELRVVDDQYGSPTWAGLIADATAVAVRSVVCEERLPRQTYHLTSSGKTTWCEFARTIIEHAFGPEKAEIVKPIPTSEFPTPAARPAYSVLDTSRFESDFDYVIPHWRDSFETVASRSRA